MKKKRRRRTGFDFLSTYMAREKVKKVKAKTWSQSALF